MANLEYQPQLRRKPGAAMLGGVCAGLAEYLDTDRTLVRVAAVTAGVLLTKLTIISYAVAWFLLDD